MVEDVPGNASRRIALRPSLVHRWSAARRLAKRLEQHLAELFDFGGIAKRRERSTLVFGRTAPSRPVVGAGKYPLGPRLDVHLRHGEIFILLAICGCTAGDGIGDNRRILANAIEQRRLALAEEMHTDEIETSKEGAGAFLLNREFHHVERAG